MDSRVQVVKDGPHKNRLAKVIHKGDGKNPWYTLKADDGNRIIKFRKHELRLLKSQISPRRRQPKRGAQTRKKPPSPGKAAFLAAWEAEIHSKLGT